MKKLFGKYKLIEDHIDDSIEAHLHLKNCIKTIELAVSAIVFSYEHGGKVLVFGNGGSAADAQHFAGELVSKFYFDRPPLQAFSLSTDTSVITAISNDYGYEKVFSRQIEACARKEDVVVAISTSGNSKNIIAGILAAKKNGAYVIGLSGKTGGAMAQLCDICILAPSDLTPRIQECHLLVEHIICAQVEGILFSALKQL